jgi:bifunctional DNA-binding transcriptional regulator/antitoxin component of YhaV-PrlF toxin-antitoxin module
MRVTRKGQVTIPQAIRDRYGFLPKTDILFVEEGSREVSLRVCDDDFCPLLPKTSYNLVCA